MMNILKKIFDFFCGDWRTFWGIALTIAIVELARSWAVPILVLMVLFLLGISLSLGFSLRREITMRERKKSTKST
ncbi:hypothetical protein [Desulfosporosinus metallidurans]|uniref:Uncharacterized protein n=1 Tax=Desulfosporosinus metallidurans TaxID=1888891 RepID=A0A1Q8QVW1_9FIRM|nr:hypothetical protein [Desulfosporosinus metallidurans]OLN31495.1 hypothetical protein DSOL_2668 [Desulfosporosinus metallidurans]